MEPKLNRSEQNLAKEVKEIQQERSEINTSDDKALTELQMRLAIQESSQNYKLALIKMAFAVAALVGGILMATIPGAPKDVGLFVMGVSGTVAVETVIGKKL